jgi:hypothetical protein
MVKISMTQEEQQTSESSNAVDKLLSRNGGLTYLEIPALDPSRSAAFYEKILGWRIDRSDPPHIKFLDQTGHLLGRWHAGRAISRKPGLLPFFYVDRIDEAVSLVVPHGGQIVKAPYVEGNLLVAAIRDPAGNMIGLWQEASG